MGGPTAWLTARRIVSPLQWVERERGMIKQSGGKLRDNRGARRFGFSQGSRLRGRGCVAVLTRREVTVAITIHDKLSDSWRKGAVSGQLRDKVQTRSKTICRKLHVTAPEKEGTNEFEFWNTYKSQGASTEWAALLRRVSYCAFPLLWNYSLSTLKE